MCPNHQNYYLSISGTTQQPDSNAQDTYTSCVPLCHIGIVNNPYARQSTYVQKQVPTGDKNGTFKKCRSLPWVPEPALGT